MGTEEMLKPIENDVEPWPLLNGNSNVGALNLHWPIKTLKSAVSPKQHCSCIVLGENVSLSNDRLQADIDPFQANDNKH